MENGNLNWKILRKNIEILKIELHKCQPHKKQVDMNVYSGVTRSPIFAVFVDGMPVRDHVLNPTGWSGHIACEERRRKQIYP